MDTEYCDKCGLLHNPDDGECIGCKLTSENEKLKSILLEVGRTTHKCKELLFWYKMNS